MPGACVPSRLPVFLQAPELFDLDDGRVPKEMRELMEGEGQPTVEELLEKWDEGREEEEEEQEEEQGAQGEQPPTVDEVGPSAAPAPEEVGPVGPSMTLGEEAQERREVPARSAQGEEHAVRRRPPRRPTRRWRGASRCRKRRRRRQGGGRMLPPWRW